MRIYVDADACPVVRIVEEIAIKYEVPVTLLCDTNHVLTSDYSEVIVVGTGADAVDFKLISLLKKGEHDIVVTQDYARVVSHADGCACTYGHMTSTATLSTKCDVVWQQWRLVKMPL